MFHLLRKLSPKKGKRLLCRLCVNSARVYSEYFTDYFFKVQREIDMGVAPSLCVKQTALDPLLSPLTKEPPQKLHRNLH
jgi:hypothetical protein